MKEKLRRVATHPKTKEALHSLKPQKSVWGVLGVVLFFILPEIVAFIDGERITAYAQSMLAQSHGAEATYYQALVFLFEDGGSYVNLAIGFALLVWLFF